MNSPSPEPCHRHGSCLFPLLGAATLALSAMTLSAQTASTDADAVSPDRVNLDTFVVSTSQDKGYRSGNSVSATRIDTPIADLPFSISAFTQQFIKDTGATDLFDVVRYAAGVNSFAREFQGGNAQYTIRGFTQGVMHDGFGAGDIYVDTLNVERVEVVKGPASLLYGQIQPGGIVNFITKTPKENPFVEITAGLGSYDYARA